MPFISTEEVAAKRKALKAALPDYKLSVTKSNHSSINVAVISGPVKMTENEDGRESVNHFYIEKHYADRPEVRDVLMTIYEIIKNGKTEEVYDVDYGSVPTFYTNISIGKWKNPYVVKPAKVKKVKKEVTIAA
jgi:hypothetical protein